MEKKLQQMIAVIENLYIENYNNIKIWTPRGVIYLCQGAIYMYMTISFKHICSSVIACLIKAKFLAEPPCRGRVKVCINCLGHITKMAVTPIYGKHHLNLIFQNQKLDYFES